MPMYAPMYVASFHVIIYIQDIHAYRCTDANECTSSHKLRNNFVKTFALC